jgi:Rrf2 family cysteine metabolism transcriptional repressor
VKLSNRVDYACRALLAMSPRHADRVPVTVPDIAAETGLPGPYLVQVLSQVRSAGLVHARRGAGGGYVLARHPATITMADVVVAVHGPVDLGPTSPPAPSADPAQGLLTSFWEDVSSLLHDALARVSLDDLAHGRESFRDTGVHHAIANT